MTMRAFRLLVALLFLLAPVHARAGQRTKEYPVTGMIVSIAPAAKTFTASIQAIPNFMAAMTMPFEVRQASELQGLTPGTVVSFTLVVEPIGLRVLCETKNKYDRYIGVLFAHGQHAEDVEEAPRSVAQSANIVREWRGGAAQREPRILSRFLMSAG